MKRTVQIAMWFAFCGTVGLFASGQIAPLGPEFSTTTKPTTPQAPPAPSTSPRGPISGPNFPYPTLVYGNLCVLTSGQSVVNTEIVAGPDPQDGRGLTVFSNDPKRPITSCNVRDSLVIANGDDGCSVWNSVQGVRFSNCWFLDDQAGSDKHAHQTKCFLAGADNNLPAPNYSDWFTADHCMFAAFMRVPDIRGGVFRITNSILKPSARNVWWMARGNVINTDIHIRMRPPDATWWDSTTKYCRPICLREPVPDGLYFSGCDLYYWRADGTFYHVERNVPGSRLCRLWHDGNLADSDDDVSPKCFRSAPN